MTAGERSCDKPVATAEARTTGGRIKGIARMLGLVACAVAAAACEWAHGVGRSRRHVPIFLG